MTTSTPYRTGGVVAFHRRGPHLAEGRDVPLTVIPMPPGELRHYDWLLDTLREDGYHGDIVAANVYFADTDAFLGAFFSDGRRAHVEWWNDVTLDDLEFVAEVRTGRIAQIALNYMVDRWNWAHGRVLPIREPWEDDESLASRRRAVLKAHTLAGRPSPSAATLARVLAEQEAAAAEKARAEAEKRAAYEATIRTSAFGFDVDLADPYRVIDLAKAGRPGRCDHPRCTQPAPVAIEADPWIKRDYRDRRPTRYRACAFHFLNALDLVFGS
ncbi:hypothetical protein ACQEU8_36205 [Streptomyces sp. CA-250714]|uniref:hypothetical protein n=1 Tax=Streptomyces sp. CA-250714 TaxID=3240060 RepID=UPI003D8B34E9